MLNPWGKPRHPSDCNLTSKEIKSLKKIGSGFSSVLRIGYKEKVSSSIVSKTNAHLASEQLVKVEFIKMKKNEIKQCCEDLAQKTGSLLVDIHGSFALFFRKHPNKNIADIIQKYI